MEILYMNHGPLLSTLKGIRELCNGYDKVLTVSWYDFESPEGEKFMAKKGVHQHLPLVNCLGIAVGIALFVSINAVSAAYSSWERFSCRPFWAASRASWRAT